MKGGPRYYTVKRGRAYWQPTESMRLAGFEAALGPDGRKPRALAERYIRAWDKVREWDRSRVTSASAFNIEAFSEASAWMSERSSRMSHVTMSDFPADNDNSAAI